MLPNVAPSSVERRRSSLRKLSLSNVREDAEEREWDDDATGGTVAVAAGAEPSAGGAGLPVAGSSPKGDALKAASERRASGSTGEGRPLTPRVRIDAARELDAALQAAPPPTTPPGSVLPAVASPAGSPTRCPTLSDRPPAAPAAAAT